MCVTRFEARFEQALEENRMKKILALLIAAVTLVSLSACKEDEKSTSGETTPTTTVADTTAVETTEPPVTTPAETEPPEDKVYTLTFVGDCTLGTAPSKMSYSKCFINLVKNNNYEYPFASVSEYFRNDDCTFINLESVLANSGTPEKKKFTFRGPVDFVNIMTCSSVEVANLANNHTYDFGAPGYKSTIDTLQANNVTYIEKNGYALYTTESGLTIGMYGINFDLDENDMKKDIALLKDAGAEIIVAAVHWGIEKSYTQNAEQISIGHKLIDAGVDIVWGHHPHVLQPVEEYNGGIIYYSTANFSFGGNHNPPDKDTAVFRQTVIETPEGEFKLGELTVIPCRVSSKTSYNDFQPTPYTVDSEAYKRTMNKIFPKSK